MFTVDSGLENFCQSPSVDDRVGLLTNVASLTHDGRTAFQALSDAGVNVAALFAPEHGYFGLGAAGETIVDSHMTARDGQPIPIYSLYGTTHTPAADTLRTLNAVLIDLQDVGARWYTFLATICHTLHACAKSGVPVIVLDRPNPQGGLVVEGPLAEPNYFSMVAPAALPIRYGLTIGEAAHWFNELAETPAHAKLTVVPLNGWKRTMLFSDTGWQWAAPSPNMPRSDTALLYTGTCLIEGTIFSEGRGTALPFEQIGAPFVQSEALTEALNVLTLPGVRFAPAWFRPTTSKYAGQNCGGVRIFITDPMQVRGFALGLHLMATLRRLYPADFGWATWSGQNTFDKLAATSWIRTALEHGQPVAEIVAECEPQALVFQANITSLRLYD
ncbi:MAG: exo-beta-N-acetylmuramidase NamZ family protein [Aggregatilineales bacterium]